MRPIGYYVHHQGEGHRQRALLVARALRRPCVLIGTFNGDLPSGDVVDLPDDRMARGFEGADDEAMRPLSLHYAPLGHPGVRGRMACIAAWIASANPAAIVVDVSVEVAMLARLLSVPTIVWRLAGDRTDPPHLDAFRAAELLIAPLPDVLDHPATPDWVRSKTLYAGLVGAGARRAPPVAAGDGRIVVLHGRGGQGPILADLAAAARAVPDREWHVLGTIAGSEDTPELPGNLRLHGWVDDVDDRLARAALVVGSGGDGVLAAAAGAGKRLVCVAETRPYGEQVAKAEALARLGAAVAAPSWPNPAQWPAIVSAALALDPRILAAFAHPNAVSRVADAIEAVAAASELRAV